MKKITTNLRHADLARAMCNHVIGDNHTHVHRLIAGTVFICVGVLISKGSATVALGVIHIIGDGFGYLIHAFGSVPWIELLIKLAKPTENVDQYQKSDAGNINTESGPQD